MTYFYSYKSKVDFNLTDEEIKSKVIAKSEKEFAFDDIVSINGSLYTTHCAQAIDSDRYCDVSKIEMLEEEDVDDLIESEITCPYCNHDIESFEMADSEDDYRCGYCGSIFSYQREVSVDYWCYPKERNTEIEEI